MLSPPPRQPILYLPHGVPELIQATTALPTYSSFLSELVNNSLDAQASYISCWINPSSWSMRVTDDGQGIAKDDLKGGLGCERGMSSKYRPSGKGENAENGFLRCHGQALASMGTLAALEIISRREGCATTYHKSIKNGKALTFLSSEKYAKPSPGTSIILKDIYHSVRVKRSLGSKSSSTSVIQECKKVLEVAILGWASNPASRSSHLAITLTLEDDLFCGVPAKRVLDIKANTDILRTYARLFGLALTETAKSFRASSQGLINTSFMNGKHMGIPEMSELVEDIFKSHGILDSQEDDPHRRSSKGGDGGKLPGKVRRQSMKPVFLLHLMLPKSELIHGLEPLGNLSHLKNNILVRKVMSLTLKNVLKSACAQNVAGIDKASSASISIIPKPDSVVGYIEPSVMPSRPSSEAGGVGGASVFRRVPRYELPLRSDTYSGISEEPPKNADVKQKPGPDINWLTKALQNRAQQVFPKTHSSNVPNPVRKTWKPDTRQALARADTSLEEVGIAHIQFSKQDLSKATFLSQIDNKFICCAIPHRDDRKTLVMIDQHAADERVRVERFLRETLRDFQTTKVTSTLFGVVVHSIKLPLEQIDWLMERPERLALFEKWGFQISVATDPAVKTASYRYISVNSVPALLISRLGSTGGKDVKDIIAGYIAFLQTQPDGRISSLVQTLREPADCLGGVDNDGLLRWMPKRMKELIDSKACRGAIMFNDPLTVDNCELLIAQLSKTSFPFLCAHGRPSIFPVGQIPPCSVQRFSIPIDWSKQILE